MATASLPYIVPLSQSAATISGSFDIVYNDSAGVYTDLTADLDDTATTGGALTGASGDHLYLGCTSDLFDQLSIDVNTAPAGGTRTWEYYNGSTWSALTITWSSGNNNLTVDSIGYFTAPTDWATTTVNGTSAYWIRGRVTGVYSTAGTVTMARVGRLVKVVNGMLLYHAATTGRVWNEAMLRYTFNVNGIACTMQRIRVGVQLGSSAISYYNATGWVTNTGEHYSDGGLIDVSDIFSSSFGTGVSQSINVWMSAQHAIASTCTEPTQSTANYTMMLLADVDYDTANTTITKTALIPLECGTARLTNSLAEIGTNQVPQLTGAGSPFIPESSVTVRHTAFWMMAHNPISSTSDFSLAVALDAEAETAFTAHSNGGNTTRYFEHLWIKSFDTTTTHAFKARGTVNNAIFSPSTILCVTYDCDPASSTQLISRLEPFTPCTMGYIASGSALQSSGSVTLTVPETSVTLKQSAILGFLHPNAVSAMDFVIAAGTQSARTYSIVPAGAAVSGMYVIQHRIDSGGASGAGITLSSGWNTLHAKFYTTAGAVLGDVNGFVILNYHAAKPSGGEYLMSRYKLYHFTDRVTFGTPYGVNSVAPNIPLTNYWLNSVGVWGMISPDFADYHLTVSPQDTDTITWVPSKAYHLPTGDELGLKQVVMDLQDMDHAFLSRIFKLHPSDPAAGKLNLETSRTWRFVRTVTGSATVAFSGLAIIGYHGMTWTKAMDVSQYGGTGSGLTVDVYHKNTGQKLYTATTGTAGDLQLTGYDNAETYFAICREDSTHVGRSDDFTFDNT